VVIFDEAHNLEGIASEAASADLTSYDLAGAMGELDTCIATASNEASYYGAASGGHNASNSGVPTNLVAAPDLSSLLILKQLLLALEEEIDAVPLPQASVGKGGGGGGGVSRNGSWLLELLARHSVTCDTAELLVRIVVQIRT
jgi:hypothetical protein